jgi:hypothetical protein
MRSGGERKLTFIAIGIGTAAALLIFLSSGHFLCLVPLHDPLQLVDGIASRLQSLIALLL